MIYAFIVDANGEATDIFEWEMKPTPIDIRFFYSEDREELGRVKAFFKPKKLKLTQDIINQMLQFRTDMDLLPLKDMMEKYIGHAPCCLGQVDEILKSL